jgi:hypothetical protein
MYGVWIVNFSEPSCQPYWKQVWDNVRRFPDTLGIPFIILARAVPLQDLDSGVLKRVWRAFSEETIGEKCVTLLP